MPRIDAPQQVFNGGEFGPLLVARSDFSKYNGALRKAENILPLAQGGARRRGCTRYVVEVKDSSAETHLIPFQFSTTQAYMLEAGNLYFRFMRNQGVITAQNITASITGNNSTFDASIGNWDDQGLSGGTGSVTHDATNDRLNLVSVATPATNYGHAELEVTNSTAIEHIFRFQVIGAPGDTVKLRIGTASNGTQIINDQLVNVGYHSIAFTATAANFFLQFKQDTLAKTIQIDNCSLLDNVAVELTTPYTTAQVPDLRWAQSADTLYICHSAHPVYKLLRFGHSSWSLEEVSFSDGPYLAENATETTINPGGTTGLANAWVASSIIGINNNEGFKSTDVGRLFRYSDGTNIGYGVIVTVTDTLNVSVDIRDDLPVSTAKTTWSLGGWSSTTGYPRTVHFHEQRLLFANTTTDPDKFWLSVSADFENMRPDSDKTGGGIEVLDSAALDYRISSAQVNAVYWARSGKQLTLGTLGGEWVVTSDGPILTPTDVDVKQQTSTGGAFVDPVQVDNVVLFMQRGKRQLREFAFNFEADGFRAPDMTILAGHITQTKIIRMTYAQSPGSLMIGMRGDGRLAVLSYKREQDVVGWSRWTIGGSFSSGIAVVESVAVIPGNNGSGQVQDSSERDEIWVVVKRTINSATVRYIEVFEEDFEGPDRNDYLTEATYETALLAAQKNAYYADSVITYDGSASGKTANLAGYTHIIGETVKVLADGAVHPDVVVDSSGEIALEYDASVVQVGLGYFHDIEHLKLDAGNPAGSAIAKNKRFRDVSHILHECGSLVVGPDRGSLKNISLREVSDAMDTAVPLFTGTIKVGLEGDYIPDPRIIYRDDAPSPFTLLALVVDAQVEASH